MVTARYGAGVRRGNDGSGPSRYDALYARYSSHAQDDSTSVAVQIEACERAAGQPLAHFIDQAKTGRTTGGRTELQRLIAEAQSRRIRRLYVYKFDRLGRAAETHMLVEDLETCGVEVISVTEGTNALARGVQLVVAADYSRVLAERTRAGLIKRHEQGAWTGGPAPYGYHVITSEDGRRRLAPHPEETELVRWVFSTYLTEAVGFSEIARRLQNRGVPTRFGGPWYGVSVRSILTNRTLVGELRFLRRSFHLNRETGRRLPHFNDENLHTVKCDESLRIIDDDMFARAQAQIAANSSDKPRGVTELRPFTGRLFCGVCGNVCYSRKSANRKGKYVYYSCGRRLGLGLAACSSRGYVREDMLLGRVQAALAVVFEDTESVLASVHEQARKALDENRVESARLKRELAEIDRTISGLLRLLVDSDITADAKRSLSRQMGEAELKRDSLRRALEAAAVQTVQDAGELMNACRDAFSEAKEDFAKLMTPAQTNRFIAEIIGPIRVMPDGTLRPDDSGAKKSTADNDVSGASSGGRI